MTVVLAIANHNGGVGKTITAANLAAGFAGAGRRTLAVDCDPQAPLTRWLLGHLRQQAERRQPNQKAIRSFPAAQPKRHPQRSLLGTGQAPQPIKHRRTQLMQGGEREPHLRLDADRPQDAKVRGRADRVVAAPSCSRPARRGAPGRGCQPCAPR